MTVPQYGAPGFRFFKDLYPSGREGGLSYYPYSAIERGLDLSATFAAGAPVALGGLTSVNVNVAAGAALLDSMVATLNSATVVAVNPVVGGVGPSSGDNDYAIFLNPTRKLVPVPIGGAAPATLLNGQAVQDGDMYCTCVDDGESFVTQAFYKRQNGTFLPFDPTFSSPGLPAQRGRNRNFGNDSYGTVAASNFTVNAVEKEVYVGELSPNYTYRNSLAVLRKSASLYLGSLKLHYYVLPLTITAALNSTTAVVVDPIYSDLVNSLVLAAGNANLFALSGNAGVGAGAIGNWNNATRTLTLGAAATITGASVPLTLGPATPGNIYLLSPTLSQVVSSGNYTNP